jgi:ArsR family transcriptional regulator
MTTSTTSCCLTADANTLPPMPDPEAIARLAWGLAHPARVRILQLLVERQACICGEIVEVMDLAQSTISQHLKILKEAGLIKGEVNGPKVCYCIQRETLETLKRLIGSL